MKSVLIKTSPNLGIKLSLRNGVFAGLISGSISGLFIGLTSLTSGLSTGLFFGLFVVLIVGLNRGGAAAIKHYALRFVLWRNGHTPLNLIKFLD
jgi:hypothetical protein